MISKPSFRLLAGTTGLIAVLAFGLPFGLGGVDPTDIALQYGCPLSLLWLALVVVTFVIYRKRALWTLFGIPLALFWPVFLGIILFRCAVYHACP